MTANLRKATGRYMSFKSPNPQQMKDLYIFSGLGADERVFKLMDFNGFNPVFMKWENPISGETMESYAKRISTNITTPKPNILGLSFGGLMAIEVAKQMETDKIVLIASAKTRSEIPFYYRTIGLLGLHKLLPTSVQKQSNFITNWLFGAKSDSDKKLLKQILKDTDPIFLRWAVDKVVSWKNEIVLHNIFHIHGTSDKILPLKFVDCDIEIKNGGHLMTMDKAAEISKIIKQHLQDS
jgi:esterase/lipase